MYVLLCVKKENTSGIVLWMVRKNSDYMFLNSFYIITIIKKPAVNTVRKTIFAFYSIDNSSHKLPWAALQYCRIGDSCAVPVSFVTFACLEGDCEHVRLVSCKITILGSYEIKGVVSCITSISVCFLFTLNWWTRLDHAGRSWPTNRHSSHGFTQTSRFLAVRPRALVCSSRSIVYS